MPGVSDARDLIRTSKRVAFLTGAGISAESGIQTFRDAGGLWENYAIDDVATPEGFDRNPELVWKFYNARRVAADRAVPNAAHLALGRFEQSRIRFTTQTPRKMVYRQPGYDVATDTALPVQDAPVTVITQNVDGLHQRAGNENVLELHGSVWRLRCVGCEFAGHDFPMELPILPKCERCAALLRPDIVWFGEALDPDVLRAAERSVQRANVVVVVGTSGLVQPAASLPLVAIRAGIPVIEINKEETPLTSLATHSLRGLAGKILPDIL